MSLEHTLADDVENYAAKAKWGLAHLERQRRFEVCGEEFNNVSLYGVDENTPVVYYFKHQSVLDVLLPAVIQRNEVLRRVYPVVKEELINHGWKKIRNFFRCIPSISTPRGAGGDRDKVARRDAAFAQVFEALESERDLYFAPEGTRVSGKVGRIRTGFLRALIRYKKNEGKEILMIPLSYRSNSWFTLPLFFLGQASIEIHYAKGHLLHDTIDDEVHAVRNGLINASGLEYDPSESSSAYVSRTLQRGIENVLGLFRT